jgi:ureidoglycolate lyase
MVAQRMRSSEIQGAKSLETRTTMKLLRYMHQDRVRIGALREQAAVDLGDIAGGADMLNLIANWDSLKTEAGRRAASAPSTPLSEVRLLAPVARPGKIFAIGLNYADHIAESGLPAPKHQVWFSKAVTCVNGPYDPIELPLASSSLDYEVELVAVIGRRAKHVPVERALDVVFGFCAGNDVSVRDWQLNTSQWVLGKSFDTHAPIGPWIVTADELGDPHCLELTCSINGEVRQHSNTQHMVFNVFDQIAHLSRAMTLEPGDLIFTGTPGGVGAVMKPPVFLKAGDRARVEIEGIGFIENTVALERAPETT